MDSQTNQKVAGEMRGFQADLLREQLCVNTSVRDADFLCTMSILADLGRLSR
jgi:hypothetical protein